MTSARQQKIITIILANAPIGISGINEKLDENISVPTLNRELSALKSENYITASGKGPGIRYEVNKYALSFAAIDADAFFKTDVDERVVIETFNHEIFSLLKKHALFTADETTKLDEATLVYRSKKKKLNAQLFKKEFERLLIELSWKSSQIEGNTYDLLDTEQLLKYNIKSDKYTIEEATMLLNHKKAIEYTMENSSIYKTLKVRDIIDIHTLLTQKMGISKILRKRVVRITGTRYTPPANPFVIEEALEKMCGLVNSKKNKYEKAFLALVFISYIQPFDDGNKRTARLTANALLMSNNCCPLSYRSVNTTDYKKATLLFYELNNVLAFKEIFTSQYLFATENYF